MRAARSQARCEGTTGRSVRVLMLGILVLSLLPVSPAAGDDDATTAAAPHDLPVIDLPDGVAGEGAWSDDDWLARTDRLVIEPVAGVGLAQASERSAALLSLGTEVEVLRVRGGHDLIDLGADITQEDAEALAAELVREGLVLSAEPEPRAAIASWPVNDTHYSSQWHLHGPDDREPYGIDAPAAWSVTTGSEDVVVAVLDTGILEHQDIVARLVPGYDFVDGVPGGLDPGDWTVAGQCGLNTPAEDSSWHGLHVAGTIGATTDNALGVAGVDQRARILPVRVLGPCGGNGTGIANGIRWAAGLPVSGAPTNPNPADVINLSLGGGGGACPDLYQNAIDAARAAGAVVVAAAGNSNIDAAMFRPANCKGVMTVAATDRNGARASYSNYGEVVDIAAPGGGSGSGVLSLLNTGTKGPEADALAWYGGTSMASPHVAGVAALLRAVDPELTPDQVATILADTAAPFATSAPEAWLVCSDYPSATYHCGAGILDAGAAAAAAVPATTSPPKPATPTGVAATAGELKVTVSWNSVSGAADYQLYRTAGSAACTTSGTRITTSKTKVTDTKVKVGTKYNYCVRARNSSGTSSLSATRSATPTAPPPTALTWSSDARLAFDLNSGGVKLSWPKASGTVARYRVQRNGSTIGTTTSLSHNVTGLSNGRRYQLRVRAENSGGSSPWLTMNITPTAGFRDVPSSSSFRTDIRWLATAEVTRGCNPPTNDRFCPGEVVTREQMAAFMVRALGLTETSSRGRFTDVPASNTFRTDINKLATAGITAGCNPPTNTRFCPKDPVSREQMAAFMTRALKLSATSNAGNFRDVPSSNTFRTDINRLATAGITAGCNPPTNDRFCPKDPVTRQQMAAFMRRALAG